MLGTLLSSLTKVTRPAAGRGRPAAPADAPLAGLRERLTGDVALPGEAGYGLATPWNVAVPVTPRAVVSAASGQDVAETVRFARAHGLRIAVQRTGHGATPVGEDTLLVHTGRLDECTVHADEAWIRVGAGVVWQQVLDAATPHGLAPLCGSAPGVGVVGFLTGGGLGPMARTYGVSADHVRALEVVTGDGRLRRATPTEHPELFWGLRGGKATLGIVTAVEFDVPRLSEFYGGCLYFDGEDATAVLHAWREFCADLPEQGTTSAAFVQLPPLPEVPPPLAGRLTIAVRFVWTGDPAAGERLLAPVRAAAVPVIDAVARQPYAAIGAVHADPVDPMPSHEDLTLLHGLPAEALDALIAAAGPGSGSRQTIVELRQLGGAVARAPRHRSAFSHRDAAFTLAAIGVPAGPGAEAVRSDARRITDAAAPWSTGGGLPNFGPSVDPDRIARCYDPETLRWLGTLAEQYDPAGVFDVGQAVRSNAG